MTDATPHADTAADIRGRPGAGAQLAEQMGEAGARRERRRDVRPLGRLLPYAMRHKGHAAMAGVWLILSTAASLALTAAARGAIASRYDASYVPDKPRLYTTKAKNAQEAHEAIRPTDFGKDRAGSGDHARLYDLVFKRAMASQMASARLERTTVEFVEGTGQHALRATGQVVLFPGYLALYEEGKDEAAEDEGRLPRMKPGDAPAKKGVRADQHFTQPPPRYSEATLVKKMEELGIGRPSTYASILQTLKDRDYVSTDKNRFTPNESGRLVTAFLERFFERYVSYDYTAGLEESLDDVSGGRMAWQAVLDAGSGAAPQRAQAEGRCYAQAHACLWP